MRTITFASYENESNRNKVGITNIKVGNDKIKVCIAKNKVDITMIKVGITKNKVGITQIKVGITKNSVGITQNKVGITKINVSITKYKAGITNINVGITQIKVDILKAKKKTKNIWPQYTSIVNRTQVIVLSKEIHQCISAAHGVISKGYIVILVFKLDYKTLNAI